MKRNRERLGGQLPLELAGYQAFPLVEEPVVSNGHTSFPTEEVNELAALESFNKHLFRPNTYLHKWWARRSGTTFRYILKQLTDNPLKRDYYESGGLEGKVILDPMMGGGTTIHEAIRLGASVIGCDIDPIPVVQAEASLTRLSLREKIGVFDHFSQLVSSQLTPLFVTSCPTCRAECETQFVLYGVRKRCDCGEVLLIDSFQLRQEADGRIIELDPYTREVFIGERRAKQEPARQSIYEKATRACPLCNMPFRELKETPYWERYVPLVVAGYCEEHKQFFKQADKGDHQVLQRARALYEKRADLPLPGLTVQGGPKSNDLLSRGITSYADLFSPRQTLYITVCKEALETIEAKHQIWLALLISTSLEFNSMLCGYKGSDKRRPGAIRHVFSHHAYSFPYTALENNPVFSGNTSGTLGRLFRDRVQAASLWAEAPLERKRKGDIWQKVVLHGEVDGGVAVKDHTELGAGPRRFLVIQGSSSRLPLPDTCVDHVVTDPPYYDSVQYSDLAHFFRVWLRWLLPEAATWNYDTSNSAVAETSQDGLKYQKTLGSIWSECHRVLRKPDGRLVFTFHHWRPEAWAHLTLSLKQAGFRLMNSYTVLSENPISVHIRQLNALKHDSILFLYPAECAGGNGQFGLIERISTDDSFTFCSDCATLLGYCLETDLTDEQVMQIWRTAIGT